MNKTVYFALAISLLVLSACGNKKDAVNTLEEVKETDTIEAIQEEKQANNQSNFDPKDSYKGLLPCADCLGIQTEMNFLSEDTYVVKSVYLGKSDEVIVSEGKYQYNELEKLLSCRINNKIVSTYQVVGEQLIPKGSQGGNTIGGLEKRYILRKNSSPITERYWVATELMGEDLTTKEGAETVYLLLTSDQNFSASGGCNSMFGAFELKAKNMVSFSEIAMSEKECSYKHYDMELSTALQKCERFVLLNKDSEMHLMVGKAAPLAKFKRVGF